MGNGPFYFKPYNNGIPLQRSQQFPTTGSWRSILPPKEAQISSGGITAFQQQLTDNNDIFINKVNQVSKLATFLMINKKPPSPTKIKPKKTSPIYSTMDMV